MGIYERFFSCLALKIFFHTKIMTTKIIPVTILTWFLGSGKTTLLNHILKNKEGYKIAVIENEFGEEGVDGDLIEKTETIDIIEIQNGCMCCMVRWDFIKWVRRLLDSGKDFDYLIIEASGMSEPLPIAQTFLMEDFSGRVKLDSIVCLIDAQNFQHNLVQSLQTTFEQIEFANFIVLNKTDWVKAEELTAIKKTIKELNTYGVIIETNYGKVDLKYILDTTRFEMTEEIEKELWHHHHHHHDSAIWEYLFKTQEKCFHLENMKQFLSELPDDIFRVKGFIHFKDYPNKRYILQKAGSCFSLSEDENWDMSDELSRIVFIGKNIDATSVQDTLLKNVFFDIS